MEQMLSFLQQLGLEQVQVQERMLQLVQEQALVLELALNHFGHDEHVHQ
jgi:hypothetical protein